MIDQEDNEKKGFDEYTLNTIKSMAAAMRFFAVMIFVLTGCLFLLGFYSIIFTNFILLISVGVGIAFNIYTTLEILKCSNAFRDYVHTLSAQNLDLAFRSMNLYWRYLGIQLLLSILMSILFSILFPEFL
jgi:hypothetical protein